MVNNSDLKVKDMPVLRGGSFGDLYIKIITEIPTSLSPKQKQLLEELEKSSLKRPNTK